MNKHYNSSFSFILHTVERVKHENHIAKTNVESCLHWFIIRIGEFKCANEWILFICFQKNFKQTNVSYYSTQVCILAKSPCKACASCWFIPCSDSDVCSVFLPFWEKLWSWFWHLKLFWRFAGLQLESSFSNFRPFSLILAHFF